MFVVEALRWGDRSNHSYVVGVYTSLEIAARSAIMEEYWRGGKYSCKITKYTPDDTAEQGVEEFMANSVGIEVFEQEVAQIISEHSRDSQ